MDCFCSSRVLVTLFMFQFLSPSPHHDSTDSINGGASYAHRRHGQPTGSSLHGISKSNQQLSRTSKAGHKVEQEDTDSPGDTEDPVATEHVEYQPGSMLSAVLNTKQPLRQTRSVPEQEMMSIKRSEGLDPKKSSSKHEGGEHQQTSVKNDSNMQVRSEFLLPHPNKSSASLKAKSGTKKSGYKEEQEVEWPKDADFCVLPPKKSGSKPGSGKVEHEIESPKDADFCVMPPKKSRGKLRSVTAKQGNKEDTNMAPEDADFGRQRMSRSREDLDQVDTEKDSEGDDSGKEHKRKTSFIQTTLSALHLNKKDRDLKAAEAELYEIDRSTVTPEPEEEREERVFGHTWHGVTFSGGHDATGQRPLEQADPLSMYYYTSDGETAITYATDAPANSGHRNNNSKLVIDAHEAQKHHDNDLSKVPPASAPPIVQKKDSSSLLRKFSRKIKSSMAKKHEGLRDDSDDENKPSRKNQRKFDFVDLTLDDFGESPPTRKMTYPEYNCYGTCTFHIIAWPADQLI